MGIRIKSIYIKRTGPLREDFNFEPEDINLIYGLNETGKTCIVEGMISYLFRTTRGTPWSKILRKQWNLEGGNILVSGLGEENTRFDLDSSKLEDIFKADLGLPDDLSNLIVVRSGETELSGKSSDGVGWDILKDCLSGEGILDRIDSQISKTIQNCEITEGVITGANQGEIDKRSESKKNMDILVSLLSSAESDNSASELVILNTESAALADEITELEQAKKYHAHTLSIQHAQKSEVLKTMPSESEISSLNSDVILYSEREKEKEKIEKGLLPMQQSEENSEWLAEAGKEYSNLMQLEEVSGGKTMLMVAALFSLVATVAFGLFDILRPYAIILGGLLTAVFLSFTVKRKSIHTPMADKEVQTIKDNYKKRFGKNIEDIAHLKVIQQQLREECVIARGYRQRIAELSAENAKLESKITSEISKYSQGECDSKEWNNAITDIRSSVSALNAEIRGLESELLRLNVEPRDRINVDNGVIWDELKLSKLNDTKAAIEERIKEKKEMLRGLINQIQPVSGHDSGTSWEELITALREKVEDAIAEYRMRTTDILAKRMVHQAIAELRRQEMDNVRRGLASNRVKNALYHITENYDSINLKDDHTLIVSTRTHNEFPLSELSKGAKEQVYLALRTSFAERVMKSNPAFLILDDAFQHSDYNRRRNLIDYTFQLAGNGWQIFYFTMDDNMKELFEKKAGKAQEVRFKGITL